MTEQTPVHHDAPVDPGFGYTTLEYRIALAAGALVRYEDDLAWLKTRPDAFAQPGVYQHLVTACEQQIATLRAELAQLRSES